MSRKYTNTICLAEGCNKPPKQNKHGHYTKSGFCSTCFDRYQKANRPGFAERAKASRRRRHEKAQSNKGTRVDGGISVEREGDLLKYVFNRADLRFFADMNPQRLLTYLANLREDLFVHDYEFDQTTNLVTVFIRKEIELAFSAGLNERPPEVGDLVYGNDEYLRTIKDAKARRKAKADGTI